VNQQIKVLAVLALFYIFGMASGALLEKTFFSKHDFSDFIPPAIAERHNGTTEAR